MRLKDKVVIVTGSTTGIGEAIARRCVQEGARVFVHGLERDLGEAVTRSLGRAAALHVDDLSTPEAAPRVVAAALAAFGKVDALVNNAARVERGTLETTDAEAFDRVIAVNVRAPLLLIRAALPELERARGAVLNIGSVNAYCGEPTFVAYSASKGALMTLTRNLGDTLHREHGVRVNQINPEWVLTEGEKRVQERQGNPPDWYEKLPKEFAPSGRLIRPDEIAAAAVYWIGDESRPMSGSVVDLGQFPVIGRNPPKVVTQG
jgi:NAD(P)-dependent dehydrogenase (short-subunit alcohol dehydrogenase family)